MNVAVSSLVVALRLAVVAVGFCSSGSMDLRRAEGWT